MRRRHLITAATVFALPGCSALVGDDDIDLRSEGTDDEAIEVAADELLLTRNAMGSEWEPTSSNEDCREFTRDRDTGGAVEREHVESCAWVYDGVETSQSEFEDHVERVHKLSNGSLVEEEPPVGVEAATVVAGAELYVVFRDANAVGRLRYAVDIDGRIHEDDLPTPADALEYAVKMHERWRD